MRIELLWQKTHSQMSVGLCITQPHHKALEFHYSAHPTWTFLDHRAELHQSHPTLGYSSEETQEIQTALQGGAEKLHR